MQRAQAIYISMPFFTIDTRTSVDPFIYYYDCSSGYANKLGVNNINIFLNILQDCLILCVERLSYFRFPKQRFHFLTLTLVRVITLEIPTRIDASGAFLTSVYSWVNQFDQSALFFLLSKHDQIIFIGVLKVSVCNSDFE